jgi:hypothetical protein
VQGIRTLEAMVADKHVIDPTVFLNLSTLYELESANNAQKKKVD